MSNMSRDEFDKITYGVRENTPLGSFTIASDLTREEAGKLISKLEAEAKANGSYFEDRYILIYRR